MSVEARVRSLARRPIVAYRRRRCTDDLARRYLEAVDYRRSMYRFGRKVLADPGFRDRYPLGGSSVVMDLGAYRGEWAVAMVERYGCRVHAFEPLPGPYAALERAAKGQAAISAHPFGLGATDATVEFTAVGPGSTSVDGVHPGRRVTGEVRDVSTAFDEIGVEHIDLCKVNIEGAEYDVLDRLSETGWFDRIDHLQVQFHAFHPDAHRRRRRIRRALRRTHDQEWNYDWVFESWARRT